MKLEETIDARGARYPIRGEYDGAWRPAVDASIQNFEREDETGARPPLDRRRLIGQGAVNGARTASSLNRIEMPGAQTHDRA